MKPVRWIPRRKRSKSEPRVALDYVADARALRGGNRVDFLVSGGETFPAMLEAIRSSRHYVLFVTYIFRSDRTGKSFQEALIERARSGVVVRLIYDSLGSFGTLEAGFLDALRQAGVELIEYFPVAPWRRNWALNRRNHQKILVVDGEIGFTGGLNIGDEYAPGPDAEGWHDLHVRVHGPAARDLERVFERTWVRGGGPPLSGASGTSGQRSDPAERGDVLVQTLDNLGIAERRRMVVAWRRAIRRASARITIANAYFIPGRRIRRELRAAIRRGVSVRVLLPAESDVPIVQYASQYLYHRLLRSGIRLHEMHARMMHAKAAVIDGQWATIGSYNLDRRSLFHNLEVGVVVVDAPFAQRLEAEIVKEMAAGREICLARWKERSPTQRVLEWLTYRFRYWL